MTSVVFHPSLGRFAGAELGSGSESEGYSRRRLGAAQPPSRREVGLHHGAAPGSRRFRRYVNDTTAFSESEYDTATDWESDEDRPIVRFEWEARFVQAGASFFEQATAAPAGSGAAPRRRRRLPKMARRKRGEVQEGMGDTDDEDDLALVGLGAGDAALPSAKRDTMRRARLAKFGAGADSAPHDATSAASSSSAGASESDSDAGVSALVDRSVPQGLQRCVVSERSRPRLPGQEHAATLFLQLEHSVRRALRRLPPDDSAWHMLTELEALLVRYKRGRLLRHPGDASHAASFDLLPPDSVLEAAQPEDELEAEPTSDDDDLLLVQPKAGRRRRSERSSKSSSSASTLLRRGNSGSAESGIDAPLLLVFRTSFERFLAHGVIQWHGLVGESFTSASQLRVTRVRTPRAGVLMHAARIVPYLQEAHSDRKHTL